MPIKNIGAIEESLHLEKGSLQTAIDNEEEVEITIPKLVIRTEEENTRYEGNLDADKKKRYDSGVEKGEKEAVLRVAKSMGLEIAEDKAKKIDNLLPLYKDSIIKEAKIEPDKRIQTLETELETIRGNYKTLEGEHNDLKNNIAQEKESLAVDNDILKAIPRGEGIKYNVPEEDLLFLVKRKQHFGRVNGKTVALGEDGEPLKSGATLDPKPLGEVLNETVKPYLAKTTGGTGGGDDLPGNHEEGSYDAFVAEMEKAGHKPGSEAFQKEMNDRIKNKTLKM